MVFYEGVRFLRVQKQSPSLALYTNIHIHVYTYTSSENVPDVHIRTE